jgi:peroxiredoxin
MRTRQWLVAVLAIGLLLPVAVGCRKETADKRNRDVKVPPIEVPPNPKNRVDNNTDPVEPAAKKPEPVKPAEMPKVVLDAQSEKSSLLKVGDVLPDVELADLDGKKQSLRSLFGAKLAVVLFWTSDNLYSAQALEDLQSDLGPQEAKGVRLVGIDVKDKAEDAQSEVRDRKVKYPNLADADGAFFAKVASERMPRVYLVDASGKILWFDLEYSDKSRRDLKTAVQVVLGQ